MACRGSRVPRQPTGTAPNPLRHGRAEWTQPRAGAGDGGSQRGARRLHVPVLGPVGEDLEGPLAGQLCDLSKQRTRQVGSVNDEGFTGVHRLGCAENSCVTETVGDSGRINGRFGDVVLAAATAATVDLGVGKLFDRHGVAFL